MDTVNIPSFVPMSAADFRPAAEVLTSMKIGSLACENMTAEAIYRENGITNDIARLVQAIVSGGYANISPDVKYGDYALVLECENHQFIRIAHNRYENREVTAEYALQPIRTLDAPAGYHIVVLPKVHTLQEVVESPALARAYGIKVNYRNWSKPQDGLVVTDDVETLTVKLIQDIYKDNKLFFDCKPENIGVIKDRKGHNKLVVIDPGAVTSLDNITSLQHRNFNRWLERHPAIVKQVLPIPTFNPEAITPDYRDYAEAQAAHLELLGIAEAGGRFRERIVQPGDGYRAL